VANYHFWRGNLVRLRAIEQKDLEAAAQDFGEYDTDAESYNSEISFPSHREEDRTNLEKLRKREPGDDSFYWMIENHAGEKVGEISTFDCERRVGVFKYAVLIHRPYWRRGYATEAIRLVQRFYFRELGYQKLTALVYSFNERSLHLHEKLGFIFEGRLRRTVYTNGRHYDTIYFGMTREEFDVLDPPQALWEDRQYHINLTEYNMKKRA
jgi:RimJ/RimL family protein N-acetyltransferase